MVGFAVSGGAERNRSYGPQPDYIATGETMTTRKAFSIQAIVSAALWTGVVLAFVTLGGCAKTVPVEITPAVPATATAPAVPAVVVQMNPIEAKLDKLANLGVTDLQAALTDATAHNDAVAAQCYSGLLPIVQGLKAKLEAGATNETGGTGGGVIYLFQRARDLKGSLASSQGDLQNLRKSVNLACGALQIDIQAGAADPMGLFSGQ